MRVVIADDSALLREGLARLLVEAGVEVCATVARRGGADRGGRRAPAGRRGDRHPDAADFTHEGAAAAVQLRADHPDLAILLLSQAIETHFAAQLFERHGERFGYLLKDRVVDVSTLMHALHTIAAGGTVLDPEIARRMMHVHDRSHPVRALSERERDVLGLMAEGRSNARHRRSAGRLAARRWRATSRASSPSSTCTTSPTTTGGCWRCWPR